MGYFTCINCACKYYDKRFAWEKDATVHHVCGNPQQADTHDASQPTSQVDQARTKCDVARMTGTLANWTGMAVPAAAHYLGCVSAVGGLVGASCGACQLHQGLSMPSGIVDPHLITKGAVTSAVGSTCMMLGAAASSFPALFYGAAGLGLTGLLSAITIDAHMDGLCPECRGSEEDPNHESPPRRSRKGKIVCRNSKVLSCRCSDCMREESRTPVSCWSGIGSLAAKICQGR